MAEMKETTKVQRMVAWLVGRLAVKMELHSVEMLVEQKVEHLVELWGLLRAETKVDRMVEY